MWVVQCIAILLCLALPKASTAQDTEQLRVAQTVEVGGAKLATLATSAGASGLLTLPSLDADSSGSDQVLTTTVQDPAHPDEPWVVTTYRRPDESYPAFIKRHRDTVNAVREALEEGG